MKHLISLAMKYLRRQKFRTMLTFLCITLSVFIFNMFCMGIVLIRGVMMAETMDYPGAWQLDLRTWLEKMPNKDILPVVLRTDAVVDQYFINRQDFYAGSSFRDENCEIYYFEFAVDDHISEQSGIAVERADGDVSIMGSSVHADSYTESLHLTGNEIKLPEEYEELGYAVGDEITLTVTPMHGRLSEDIPEIQEAAAARIAENPELSDMAYFADSPGVDIRSSLDGVLQSTLVNWLRLNAPEKLEFTDVVRGNSYTYTAKIAGFTQDRFSKQQAFSNVSLFVGIDSDFDFSSVMTGEFEAPDLEDGKVGGLFRQNWINAYLTINDQLDFDDSVEQLYRDLGMPEEKMQELVHPYVSRNGITVLYNTDLLALQFRGMDAISTWMTDYVVHILIFLALLFVFWALMRFVIDNAFEISVQERSAQFATIRIMGASRRQVLVLVGAEALFYSVFAVTLGVVLAHLTKYMAIALLAKFGITLPATSMAVMTAIGIVLALVAVFISAYTSSIWAARAYAPLEAAKRSYMKSGKKESVWNKNLFGTKSAEQKKAEQRKRKARPSGDLKAPRKTKLNRSQRGFLLNYTMRNIRRTRRRFLIAVITMTIGCMLFSFGLSTGACVWVELRDYLETGMRDGCDFNLYTDSFSNDFAYQSELIRAAEEKYGNHPDFASLQISTHANGLNAEAEQFRQAMQDVLPEEYLTDSDFYIGNGDDRWEGFYLDCKILTRRTFETEYADQVNISYDELVASKGVIAQYSAYGKPDNWPLDAQYGLEEPEARYSEGYKAVQTVMQIEDAYRQEMYDVPVFGALCIADRHWGAALWLLMPEENQEELLAKPREYTVSYVTNIRLTLSDSTRYMDAYEDLQQFRDEISAQIGSEVRLDNVFYAYSGLKSMVYSIAAVILIVLVSVWLTGIFTMVNTINTGVLNRCDELTMLRMIGMSQKQIRQTVSLESKIYCGISTLIGGIIGIGASLFAVTAVMLDGRSPAMTFAILFGAFIITLLINLLIAHVAAKPGLRALRERQESGRMMQ